jgi:hypothetical protein
MKAKHWGPLDLMSSGPVNTERREWAFPPCNPLSDCPYLRTLDGVKLAILAKNARIEK